MSKKDDHSAEHYDMIGWLITSFFLIFLGSIIVWINSDSAPDTNIVIFSIILVMLFGFIVARLFLRSQYRKMKLIEMEKNFYKTPSIWIYIIFIMLLEVFISSFLLKFISKTLLCVILIGLIILIMALILLETKCMEEEKKGRKKS